MRGALSEVAQGLSEWRRIAANFSCFFSLSHTNAPEKEISSTVLHSTVLKAQGGPELVTGFQLYFPRLDLLGSSLKCF